MLFFLAIDYEHDLLYSISKAFPFISFIDFGTLDGRGLKLNHFQLTKKTH